MNKTGFSLSCFQKCAMLLAAGGVLYTLSTDSWEGKGFHTSQEPHVLSQDLTSCVVGRGKVMEFGELSPGLALQITVSAAE